MGNAAREDLGDGQELIEAMLRLGMLEHIDSTLERRPFDKKRLDAEMAAYAMRHPGVVASFEERRREFRKSGKASALERVLEDRMITDAQWHASGSVTPTLPMDRAMGENPNAEIADTRGEDPSAGLDYGRGEDPSPSPW